MHQVVMNLVVNARDALSGRGRIELRTSNLHLGEDPRAPAGLSPGEYVCLSVSDDGIGMDSETRERIFEPFFTTKPDGAGTGLGLATLYGIVQQCGGGVVVDSEPGHGATFHVYLPRTRSAPRLKPAPGPPPAAGSETIVLVEDQDDVRAFVSRLLRRAGYQVIEAANGFEAIERSAGVRIHLVLADVMMPQMTGFELAHRLRESNPRLPMLFMSGYAQEGAAASEALRKLGAAYLQKPFSPEILCAKIRALLDERTPGGLAV
jgi:CheY-like chemotaxis protein